jgi:predicted dehydrogenase
MSSERAAQPGPFRFAIAGLGQHAETLAAAIDNAQHATLVAAGSQSSGRAAAFRAKYDVEAHDSYAALLERDDIDVLIVAAPNHLHKDISIRAIERGMNVLCEKPMALNEADATAMVQAAERHERSLFVGYHLRFHDVIEAMRTGITDAGIGTPLDIRVQRYSKLVGSDLRPWRHDLDQAGAGVLCDVGVHLIDLISYVTGEDVLSVHATGRPPRGAKVPEDHVVLTMAMSGGGIATVDAARGIPGGENDFHIHGTTGRLCTGPLRFVETHELTVASGDAARTTSYPSGLPYAREMDGVVKALQGRHSNVATGADGLRGVRVLAAAMRSLVSGRAEEVQTAPRETAVAGSSLPGF